MQLKIKKVEFLELIYSICSIVIWHKLRVYALRQNGWYFSRRLHESKSFEDPIPWMTYASIDFLGQCVSKSARVLEFGSGNSTIWWLSRGNSVVSLETNLGWSEKVQTQIVEGGWEDRSELRLVSKISPSELSKFQDASFDLIVNDGDGDRVEIIEQILRLLSPKGILVWDNSDRTEYEGGKKILFSHGFHELKFTGMGPINAYGWITSVFYKNFESFDSVRSKPDFSSIKY
jgi:hypothetical protein